MKSNFPEALRLVLLHEGGYVNHPRDPGGATNFGVTQRVYDAHRRRKALPLQSVKSITQADVAAIYREMYWDRVRADDLPKGLDYAVFDFAVNSGPGRAIPAMQRAIGAKPDGAIGPVTLELSRKDPPLSIRRLCADRMSFLRRLSHFDVFGRGWTRRVRDVERKALEMAS
jgi:lysozyme family protein